jgi:hypothetical protein
LVSIAQPSSYFTLLTYEDGHNDLMIMIRGNYQNHIYNSSGSDFAEKFENGGLHQHVDIPRLEKGKDSDVRTACET